MTDTGFTRTALTLDGGERFVSLRRPLELSGVGHESHNSRAGRSAGACTITSARRRSTSSVEGTLTLIVRGRGRTTSAAESWPVSGPACAASRSTRARALRDRGARRQPGAHEGRDGIAWASWDDTQPPRTPAGRAAARRSARVRAPRLTALQPRPGPRRHRARPDALLARREDAVRVERVLDRLVEAPVARGR